MLLKKMIFISILVILSACTSDFSPLKESKPEIRSLSKSEQKLVSTSQNFGFDIFSRIAEQNADSNLFISPLSISMALGMTMNGASESTYDEMQNTLGFSGMNEADINQAYRDLIDLLTGLDDRVLFEIANSIWYRNTFSVGQPFIKTNQDYFNAEVRALDFTQPSAVQTINNWVSTKTHEKIDKVIDSINPQTMMFLINAIYFKGDWLYQFEKEATSPDYFIAEPGKSIPVKMMSNRSLYDYYEDDDVQIIDLPYGDGFYSMTIFLPAYEQDLNNFIRSMDTEIFGAYISALSQDSVSLFMPKFKLEYKITLNSILKAMGMPTAFDAGQADFSRINPVDRLYISQVLHKTFVQVDEEGTEAAAVTVIAMEATGVGPRKIFMRLDRPFSFVIRERNSNTLLFMGRINAPEWEE